MKSNNYKIICIALITFLLSNVFYYYCTDNVYLNVNVRAQEREYPEYTDRIMGFGGNVQNKTIFPIKVKAITPIGGRGMEYFTTLIATWGFSEIKQNEINNYEDLEGKIILPFKEYEIGVFHKFHGDYVVNPDAYEVAYTVLGLYFKKVVTR